MLRVLSPAVVAAALALGVVPLLNFALQQGRFQWPEAYVWQVLRFTLLQAFLSTAFSIIPAIVVARALARRHFRGRQVLLALFAVPLSLPVIVALFGLTSLFGAAGLFGGFLNIYGLGGIVLAHVFFNLPLATRILLLALEAAPAESHRLAAQLGFSDAATFSHVDWPALRQALPRVVALVFLLCAGSFVIVLVLGGPQATTLEVAIYQSLRMDFDVPRALSLSLVQVCLSAALVAVAGRALTAPDTGPALPLTAARYDGTSALARSVDAAVIMAASLLVLPVLLAIIVTGVGSLALTSLLFKALATSLIIAAGSCFIALPLAWGMAQAQVRHMRFRSVLTALALGGYILPPAVIATGWFLALRDIDAGLWFTALLIAAMNALMALPFVLTGLAPALARNAAQYDALCAQLAVTGWNRLWLIDMPALKQPLAQGMMMVFVLSLGDLTAVILLGSQGLLTLPGLVQQQMGHYQSAAAGGTALVLALLCMGLSLVAQRVSRWT